TATAPPAPAQDPPAPTAKISMIDDGVKWDKSFDPIRLKTASPQITVTVDRSDAKLTIEEMPGGANPAMQPVEVKNNAVTPISGLSSGPHTLLVKDDKKRVLDRVVVVAPDASIVAPSEIQVSNGTYAAYATPAPTAVNIYGGFLRVKGHYDTSTSVS